MALSSLWIKTAATLPRHPKLKNLAESLKISTAEAVGRLVMLWIYALEFRPDGVFNSAQEIATAMEWTATPPGELVDALRYCGGFSAGFISPATESDAGRVYLHHWEDYTGGVQKTQTRNGTEKRRYKKEEKRTDAAPVTSALNFSAGSTQPRAGEELKRDRNYEAWLKSLEKV